MASSEPTSPDRSSNLDAIGAERTSAHWKAEAERLAAEVRRLTIELHAALAERDQERTRALTLAHPPREDSPATLLEVEQLRNDLLKVRQELEANQIQARDKLLELEAEVRQLKKHFLGPKSEKVPTPEAELKEVDGEKADPAETRKKRMENALERAKMDTRRIFHPVPDTLRLCPKCLVALKPSSEEICYPIIEYVGDAFEREDHILEMLSCVTCPHQVTAEAPTTVIEGGLYGPAFFAYLAVAKCGDSIPIYRIEKHFKRLGLKIPRSTMNDLIHAAAAQLEPLYERMLVLVRSSFVVRADETSMRIQKRKKRGFVWTFIADAQNTEGPSSWIITYKYSPNRSGEIPEEVLGGSKGIIVVDGHTGYNIVSDVKGRSRAGCHAHVRRKFHEALETAPEARVAIEFYQQLYRVERQAKKLGILRTAAHLALRQAISKPVMERFKQWLMEEQPKHLPKGQMGKAIKYALNQWDRLTVFLTDARIPIDNNRSEGSLRVVALGRKNYLHFGNDKAGESFAILYSLVSSCEANGVNPLEYLEDVLIRVYSHPAAKIDELLPHNWKAPTKDSGPGGSGGGGPTIDEQNKRAKAESAASESTSTETVTPETAANTAQPEATKAEATEVAAATAAEATEVAAATAAAATVPETATPESGTAEREVEVSRPVMDSSPRFEAETTELSEHSDETTISEVGACAPTSSKAALPNRSSHMDESSMARPDKQPRRRQTRRLTPQSRIGFGKNIQFSKPKRVPSLSLRRRWRSRSRDRPSPRTGGLANLHGLKTPTRTHVDFLWTPEPFCAAREEAQSYVERQRSSKSNVHQRKFRYGASYPNRWVSKTRSASKEPESGFSPSSLQPVRLAGPRI